MAFFGQRPVDEQSGGVRMRRMAGEDHFVGLGKIRIDDHLVDRCTAGFKIECGRAGDVNGDGAFARG